MPTVHRIQLRNGATAPTALLENEPGLDKTVGAPKLWAGIGGVPTLLADPAHVADLESRVTTLETSPGVSYTFDVGLTEVAGSVNLDTATATALGGMLDAPSDGQTYSRANAGWVVGTGTVGPPGPPGADGATGPAGPQGDPGPPGADSTVPGPIGPQGIQGDPGIDGADGATGPIGPQGIQGDPGIPGVDGADGADSTVPGPIGPQGIQGDPGIDGADGATGPIGPAGPAGPQGDPGPPGQDGADGAGSSYTFGIGLIEAAGNVDLLAATIGEIGGVFEAPADGQSYARNNAAWELVTGTVGPAGPQGDPGPAGADGAPGADGATGPQGPIGLTGPQGPIGLTGPAGADGAPGVDGVDGVDGAVGPAGPQGPIGLTGPAGADGAVGPQGIPGVDGADGATGPAGADGAVGPQGPIGLTGPAGADGAPGLDGADGFIPEPVGAGQFARTELGVWELVTSAAFAEPVGVGVWGRLETAAWKRSVDHAGDVMTGMLITPSLSAFDPAGVWGGASDGQIRFGFDSSNNWTFYTDTSGSAYIGKNDAGVWSTSMRWDSGIGVYLYGRLWSANGVAYNATGDFVTYDDGILRVTQLATGYADVYDATTGLRQWVGNNTTIMSLDYAGNLLLANNISAIAQVAAASVMSNSGIYYVAGNPAFYMGRENTTGRWQIVDNARELFGIDPVAGNAAVSGNIAVFQAVNFLASDQGSIWAQPGSLSAWRMSSDAGVTAFHQWGLKGWGADLVYNTPTLSTGGGAFSISNVGNTAQPGVNYASAHSATSDATKKTNVVDWTIGLDIIQQIHTVEYEFTEESKIGLPGQKYYGVTAQEVMEVLPEAISIMKRRIGPPAMPDDTEVVEEQYEEILSVTSSTIFFAAVNAIKELAARVAALEGTR